MLPFIGPSIYIDFDYDAYCMNIHADHNGLGTSNTIESSVAKLMV